MIFADRWGKYRKPREAVKLYRRAARQGNRDAQYNLGLIYEEGRGVPENRRLSFRWYLKAAERGDVDAQCEVA